MSLASPNATALPDRRAFLTTIASAGALGLPVLPALAASAHPDAALLALREPFERTWRAHLAALDSDDDNGPLVVETCTANREVVDEMSRLPARTIEGLAFKAKVSLEHEDNLYEELVTSIMDDIIAMGGAHA